MSAAVFGAWLAEALIASALLMAAVLVLRSPVRRWFGAQVAYALWALPALRLLLPPLPAAWREAAATPIGAAGETIVMWIDPVAQPATGGVALGWILLACWGGGAASFLAWHLIQHRRFCRRLLATAERLGEEDGVAVIASAAAAGPLAFGIRRRYVAFPRDFAERYDAEERQLALAHELGHHARGDLAANWAALAVLALHWCNPLAWRAFRAFRADQELANDARVLAGRSPIDRHTYACAIVKAAHGRAVSAACHLHTTHDLKGRLKMLTTSRFSRRRLAGGAATVSVLGMLGLGLTVSGSEAAAAITAGVAEVAAAQAAPATPPAPPAPATSAAPLPPPARATPSQPRAVKRIVVVKDGRTATYEGAEAEAYAKANDLPVPPGPPGTPVILRAGNGDPIRVFLKEKGTGFTMAAPPAMMQRACTDGEGDPKRTTFTSEKDGKRMVVICSNRLAQMGRFFDSVRLERNSIASARLGLAGARASIAGNSDLTDDQRRQALAGIDQAMAELKNVPFAR